MASGWSSGVAEVAQHPLATVKLDPDISIRFGEAVEEPAVNQQRFHSRHLSLTLSLCVGEYILKDANPKIHQGAHAKRGEPHDHLTIHEPEPRVKRNQMPLPRQQHGLGVWDLAHAANELKDHPSLCIHNRPSRPISSRQRRTLQIDMKHPTPPKNSTKPYSDLVAKVPAGA